jgi:hypothetical protein
MNLPLQMGAVPRGLTGYVRSRNVAQFGRVRPSQEYCRWICEGTTPDGCMCSNGTHMCCASGANCCCDSGTSGQDASCC